MPVTVARRGMHWDVEIQILSNLCAYYSVDKREGLRLFRFDTICSFGEAPGFGKPRVGVVVQRAQRLALFHCVADTLVELEAHRRVDLVFLFFPAAAEDNARHTQLFALDCCNDATGRAANINRVARVGETRGIVDYPDVATLQPDNFAKFFTGLAGGDEVGGKLLPVVKRLHSFAQQEHPGRKLQAKRAQIHGSPPESTSIDSATSMALPAVRPRG